MEDLCLLIVDGSSGLEALRQKKFPQVPFQRCVFHKLKNLWQDWKEPPDLQRPQMRDEKLKFIRQAAHIWQASEEREAWQRMQTFSGTWQARQPQAVATLQAAFEETVAYYAVMAQAEQAGKHWPARLLRTTSQLERKNRNIRRRLKAAGVFHSEPGLSACLYLNQVFCQGMRSPWAPGRWNQSIERQITEAKHFLN
jgi:putative transposase